jgi:hypothetical protein
VANQLNLLSSRQTSRDENLEAKIPGGGGRVKGGTEARTYKRASRSILDATDAAIQLRGFSSRCPGDKPNGSAILQSVIGKSEIGQSLIGEFNALPAYAIFWLRSVVGEWGKWSGERREASSGTQPERNVPLPSRRRKPRNCDSHNQPRRTDEMLRAGAKSAEAGRGISGCWSW